MIRNCKHCGAPVELRNPTGTCDHLCWPENLTDEAKRANGLLVRSAGMTFEEAEKLAAEFAAQNSIADEQTIERLAGLLHGIAASVVFDTIEPAGGA
jgi:hypothetical protein